MGSACTRDSAVVFAVLALLRDGCIAQLFVSSVNPGAGIRQADVADQFGLDADLRQALTSGRLTLGPLAQDTFANAAETACWHRTRRLGGTLLLISPNSHTPRASLVLESALPSATIRRFTISQNGTERSPRPLVQEFLEFASTLVLQQFVPAPLSRRVQSSPRVML